MAGPAKYLAVQLKKIERVVRRLGNEHLHYYRYPWLFDSDAIEFSKKAGLELSLARRVRA
jgi:hypothetical protein